MSVKSLPEILSPVGSKEMLVAAVRSGADAVYLGAKEFNARRNADNFGELDLKEAIEYCHIRGVKVFLTLNIILSDDELSNAFDLAKKAYLYGVDAVIVADIGLITLLNKHLPDLTLHASTQMTVHTASAIPFLEKLGIKRVVLARELNKQTIKEICDAAHKENIEVEVFVHGAHCMSVSGQCLLSSMLGGRSGNRGLCAGPCRLPFGVTGGNGYDLSLKDLSLAAHLGELTEIGVDSFKIEGRMKRPEYVAAATAALRNNLYKINTEFDLNLMLNNVFSRSGFTDGYFLNKIGSDMFGIRTKDDVLSASEVLSSIHTLYRNERQSVEISGNIIIKDGEAIRLTLTDGKNTATAEALPPEKAINRSIDSESVTKSLSKLGGTPFILKNIQREIGEQLSVSASTLNALRRECIEQLCVLRSESKNDDTSTPFTLQKGEISSVTPAIFCRFDSIDQIPQNLNNIAAFSLPLDSDISGVTLP
ncbi:MAG: U32 family peptidase, partial [Clostridia bacterium]|nr:U32 family peptidase [Clostridia bacterium]